MNKKVKYLTLMLFIVLALLIGINYSKLITYAEQTQYVDVNINDIYTNEDSIYIDESMTGEGLGITYSGSGFDDTEGVVIAYLDKNDSLLTAYANRGSYNYYYYYVGELEIGKTCHEAYSAVGYTDEAPGFYCSVNTSGLYLEEENKLADIKNWIVTSANEISIEEFCEIFSDKVADSNICISYNDIYGSTSNYNIQNVILLKEIAPAEFEFHCNPKELKYKEETTCAFTVTTDVAITKVKTELNTEILDIKEITVSDNWKYTIDDDGYYVFENTTGESGEFKIMDAVLTPKENKSAETDVTLLNIEYTNIAGESLYTDLNDDIKVIAEEPKEEKNPETADLNILLLSVASILLISIIVVIKKNQTDI